MRNRLSSCISCALDDGESDWQVQMTFLDEWISNLLKKLI